MCGDSTSIDAWDRLMEGERADVCFTDPPFNVDLGRKNRLMDKAVGGNRNANGAIENDKMSPDDFRDLLAGAFGCLFATMKPGAAIYYAHADKVADVFRSEFEKAGFHFS
jgi:DNA modification methylase